MLKSRILMLACVLAPAAALAAPTSQVQALRLQIAALQLDHALNLTQQQAQSLLPPIQDAKAKVAAFRSQLTSSEPARVAALTQAVADLKSTGTVAESTVQALQAARPGAGATLRQDMKSFWQQAKQVLTSSQIQALRTTQLGIGQPVPGTTGDTAGHGRFRHFARRFFLMRTLLSDDFVSLLQARAG
ncbi:MAG TPA: hypothetical protein VFG59_00135 [Anaeromyxobacter sp.]|nr:hypothetical protein [Anaeromyxobacter sp.]